MSSVQPTGETNDTTWDSSTSCPRPLYLSLDHTARTHTPITFSLSKPHIPPVHHIFALTAPLNFHFFNVCAPHSVPTTTSHMHCSRLALHCSLHTGYPCHQGLSQPSPSFTMIAAYDNRYIRKKKTCTASSNHNYQCHCLLDTYSSSTSNVVVR